MNNEVLIKVENVKKKFCRSLKRSMMYGIHDIGRDILGLDSKPGLLREDEFWSLDNISFEVRRGECLGVIGANGSGKSTLVKMLNGIFSPDEGKITAKGKIGALIEVGAGFHPMLSGRENIYINGSILGMSTKEIESNYNSIVEFAELKEFIDMPVKHYSSGMYVRLGFAIAAHVKPDVLILDEVLAVGDVNFWVKSFNAILKLLGNTAVIFVSHQMPQISRICNRILVLDEGKTKYIGSDIPKAIENYNSSITLTENTSVSGTGDAYVEYFNFESNGEKNVNSVSYSDEFIMNIGVTINEKIETFTISISFISSENRIAAQTISSFNNIVMGNKKSNIIEILIDSLLLAPGNYLIAISIQEGNLGKILVRYDGFRVLKVKGDFIASTPYQIQSQWQQK